MSEHVFIVGSRKFPNLEKVRALVRSLPMDAVIVTGTDPDDKEDPAKWGVDETAVDEARRRGMSEPIILKPDYAKHGRIAPLHRNADIVAAGARGYAFWDGKSTGTANALGHAKRLKRPVEITYPDVMVQPATDEQPQASLFDKENFQAEQKVVIPPGEPRGYWTLDQVRAYCRERANKGFDCPVCKQRAKVYKRKLNATMARVLILIYKGKGVGDWFHMPTFIKESRLTPSVYGDTTKLTYWRLLEAKKGDEQSDGNPSTGMYRLTELGARFVRDEVEVRKYVRIYNERRIKCEDETTISIQEALTSKFNYGELLNA